MQKIVKHQKLKIEPAYVIQNFVLHQHYSNGFQKH